MDYLITDNEELHLGNARICAASAGAKQIRGRKICFILKKACACKSKKQPALTRVWTGFGAPRCHCRRDTHRELGRGTALQPCKHSPAVHQRLQAQAHETNAAVGGWLGTCPQEGRDPAGDAHRGSLWQVPAFSIPVPPHATRWGPPWGGMLGVMGMGEREDSTSRGIALCADRG